MSHTGSCHHRSSLPAWSRPATSTAPRSRLRGRAEPRIRSRVQHPTAALSGLSQRWRAIFRVLVTMPRRIPRRVARDRAVCMCRIAYRHPISGPSDLGPCSRSSFHPVTTPHVSLQPCARPRLRAWCHAQHPIAARCDLWIQLPGADHLRQHFIAIIEHDEHVFDSSPAGIVQVYAGFDSYHLLCAKRLLGCR